MGKSEPTEYNRLKALLAEKKKTNKELADYLKLRPGTVSRWCTNDSQPNVATLFAIAKFLDISVCSIMVDRER